MNTVPENDRERIEGLLEIYDNMQRIDRGMAELFGDLYGEGIFQDCRNTLTYLIESLTVFPEEMNGIDRTDRLFHLLDLKASRGDRARLLMGEKMLKNRSLTRRKERA